MKKVSLITIVDNINFGTYLQAFATAIIIKRLGYNIEIVNYVRPYISPLHTSKEYMANKSMPKMKRIIYAISYPILYPVMVFNLKRFLIHRIPMSKRYNSIEELKKNPPNADIYVTGSDQVWNSNYNNGIDTAYFLGFTDKTKISYAASVGIKSFKASESQIIYDLLSKYKNISVRESFGIKALNNLGIRNVVQVLDPTLLLDRNEWLSIVTPKQSFNKKEKYLLIYSVEKERNQFVLEQAKEIAKKKNLRIYWISPTFKIKYNLQGVDKVYNFATIKTFIQLMYNADFIVASSFHGTAFAINFNKQFLSVSPSNYNTRVMSLLNLCNLEQRYASDSILDADKLEEIDYTTVNSILFKARVESLSYLKNALIS